MHTTADRSACSTPGWRRCRNSTTIGDPLTELRGYIRRKLEMARDFPRESRLFANEMLQGAPRIMPMIEGELKTLVDEKAEIIRGWMRKRPDRQDRPLSPDLLDLGDHAALCGFRRAGARRIGSGQGQRRAV